MGGDDAVEDEDQQLAQRAAFTEPCANSRDPDAIAAELQAVCDELDSVCKAIEALQERIAQLTALIAECEAQLPALEDALQDACDYFAENIPVNYNRFLDAQHRLGTLWGL